jgi:hypothetical protein
VRSIAVILVVLFPLLAMSQKGLKRRHLGTYEGSIPAFVMDTGKDLVNVGATHITIELMEANVSMTVGNNTVRGQYTVLFEGDNYMVLDCEMYGQLGSERIIVYNWGGKISRDGLYPQPGSILLKSN